MKKKFLPFGVLLGGVLLFFLCFLFSDEITLIAFQWKLKSFCEKKLKGDVFSCASVSKSGPFLFFKHIKLEKKGEWTVEIPEGSCKLQTSLKEKLFKTEWVFKEPKIHLYKPVENPLTCCNKTSHFQFSHRLTIDKGSLCFDFLNEQTLFSLDMSQGKQTKGKLSFFDEEKKQLEFAFEKNSRTNFSLFFEERGFLLAHSFCKHLLFEKFPLLADWEIVSGSPSGEIHFQDGQTPSLKLLFSANKVELKNSTLSLLTKWENIQLRASAKEDFTFHQWEGACEAYSSEVRFFDGSSFWENLPPLLIKKPQVQLKQGIITSQVCETEWLGMKGEVNFDSAQEKTLKVLFKGKSNKILPFVPKSYQKAFCKAFPEDQIEIQGSLEKTDEKVVFLGGVSIEDISQKTYQIGFGCVFGEECLKKETLGTMQLLDRSFAENRTGWIEGKHLPLKKFLSPFLFQNVDIEASGFINLKGTFDKECIVISYTGEEFRLESSSFLIEAPHINKELSSDVVALHYFNFLTFDHVGILPLEKARYKQKNLGLELTKSSAVVHFENHHIHVRHIDCFWKQLHFVGDIDVEVRHFDEIDLLLCTQSIEGPVCDAQEFLSHIASSFIWKLPLDGHISSHSNDVFLHFTFTPKVNLQEGFVRGDVKTSFSSSFVELKECTCHFDFDVEKNSVLLSNAQALAYVNAQQIPFHVAIPELIFFDFPSPQLACQAYLSKGGNTFFSCEAHTEGNAKKRAFFIEGDRLFLQGVQEGGHFEINQFEIGDFTGSAGLEIDEKGCRITRLRIKYGDLGACLFEGKVDFSTGSFIGDLSHIVVDLNGLDALSPLSSSMEKWVALWHPKGKLSGQGEVRGSLRENTFWIETVSAFHGFEFGGMHLGDGENLKCHYSSSGGLIVEGLEGQIPAEEAPLKYKLGRFHYHFETQRIEFEEFDFSLPQSQLAWVNHFASALFPGKIPVTFLELIESLKETESLEGRVSVSVYPENLRIQLNLKDGEYFFCDKTLTLSNFLLVYEAQKLFIQTECSLHESVYKITFETKGAEISEGFLVFEENKKQSEKLVVAWARDSQGQFYPKTIQGRVGGFGAELALEESSETQLYLKGNLQLDFEKVCRFFSPELQKYCEKMGIGKGYALSGDFFINRKQLSDSLFDGYLFGKDFVLGGVPLSSLSAKAHYERENLSLHELQVADAAGQLSIEKAHLCKEEGKWRISIPQMHLFNVRFSRLQGRLDLPQKRKSSVRSLIIPSLKVQDFVGIIGKKTSFLGHGELQFTNLPQKNPVSSLLLIPTEITARIGLDLSLLVPVRGTICYEIHDGKIHLTHLKNMYSDGKRSRFFLAEETPAYIDFDGNLNFKIKMKQYNLLMKLAEFFTISVKGSLLKPTYTFMNQFDDVESTEEGN